MAKKKKNYGEGSAYAYKTKSGIRYRWQASFPLNPNDPSIGFHRLSSSGFLTLKEANSAMQIALVEAKNGTSPANADVNFETYSSTWLSSLKVANSTLVGYEKIIRVHLVPAFGHLKVAQIVPTMIAKVYRELETNGNKGKLTKGSPLSANSVNKIHIVLGAILQSAVEDGHVKVNHARNSPKIVKAPTGRHIRMERKELVTWSVSDQAAFLKWDKEELKDEYFTLWLLYLTTGIRRGEGVALKWGDVNFETATLSVRRATDSGIRKGVKQTKTYKARSLLLDTFTLSTLKELKSVRSSLGLQFINPDAYIFGNLDGTIRNAGDLTERWSKVRAKAKTAIPGLPHLTIKGMRHTHVTLMLESGASAKVIQERVGHSNISTTMDVYSHVTSTMQGAAMGGYTDYIKIVQAQ